MRNITYILVLVFFTSLSLNNVLAQVVENDFEPRINVNFSYKPIKKLALNFTPEVRLNESFNINKYAFEGEVNYKLHKYLTIGALYKYYINPRETKVTEYYNKYSFSATTYKKFDRLKISFRLRYSNNIEDEITNDNYLQYKFGIKYNIPKSPITPFLSSEIYQQLNSNQSYKIRYSIGADYKICKNNYIGLSYKLDYFMQEYKNKHIVSLAYTLKF